MDRALKGTLTLCLALGLTSIAWGQAQQPRQPRQPSVLDPVLSNPGVQKELNLKDEQISKLKDALTKVRDNHKDDIANFAKMSKEQQAKLFKTYAEESNKAIAGVLDDKQLKRFKQISWQLSGSSALQDPELQKELKLTDEQKKKLDGVFDDANNKLQDLNKKLQELTKNRETNPEKYKELQKKYEELQKDIEKKANDVLTEEQKKSFKELLGKPFQSGVPQPREKR
jgi:Spy/CpxP family protein refolding chaperone